MTDTPTPSPAKTVSAHPPSELCACSTCRAIFHSTPSPAPASELRAAIRALWQDYNGGRPLYGELLLSFVELAVASTVLSASSPAPAKRCLDCEQPMADARYDLCEKCEEKMHARECDCHRGSVCGKACHDGKHHDGCPKDKAPAPAVSEEQIRALIAAWRQKALADTSLGAIVAFDECADELERLLNTR